MVKDEGLVCNYKYSHLRIVNQCLVFPMCCALKQVKTHVENSVGISPSWFSVIKVQCDRTHLIKVFIYVSKEFFLHFSFMALC